MARILISWIGQKDLNAVTAGASGVGPLLTTLREVQPDISFLLYNYLPAQVLPYLRWLQDHSSAKLDARHVSLTSPVDYREIYQASEALLKEIWAKHPDARRQILISPGTPAMQAVWILLGKTSYQAEFLQSSTERGVESVDLPFSISAEFLPSEAVSAGVRLRDMALAPVPETADFERIITAHPVLLRLKRRAAALARFDIPVLLLGETGTGKELFARAIHNQSSYNKAPFVALNCGAIPQELIDSTLFGHVQGAFTGAIRAQAGVFEQADGGTLFLDELGELPLSAQVRLLRVLQEGAIRRVGDERERPVVVRLIAATHRDLHEAIAERRFREDLYYRIAVGVLELPPLRERQGDINLLITRFLGDIRGRLKLDQNLQLAPAARNKLIAHTWPGNVRELHATLLRAAIWAPNGRLEEADIMEAMAARPHPAADVMGRSLGEGFIVDKLLDEVESYYLQRALDAAQGVKTKAAKLLGLASHQTLTKRLLRLGLEVRGE